MEVIWEDEIWKDIKGYEGLYEVSNYGRIYSKYKSKIMKDKYDYANYKVIGLTKDNRQKVLKVHRLVAQAFLSNFEELNKKDYHVDHIDGIKDNNHISNLQMLTHYDNCLKRTGSNAHQRIKVINIETNEELIFISQNQASKVLNINQGSLSNCLRGKCKTYKGYTFEYVK